MDAFRLSGLRRLDFVFSATAPLRLQAFSGSAWRGAFGHAFKQAVCAMRLRPCEGCPLGTVCAYPRFFGCEDGTASGRPFILCPDRTPGGGTIGRGDCLRVRLTMFAAAGPVAAYVVRALVEAAARGISSGRVPLDCVSISDVETGQLLDPSAIPPPDATLDCPPAPERVRVALATPLRLRLRGDLITRAALRRIHLVEAALRRLRVLGMAVPSPLGEASCREAEGLRFERAQFGWLETTRYSSRQNAAMKLGGMVGEAELDLGGAPHVWPVLWAASVLHLGKGASMGFGRVEVTPMG